MQDNLEANKLTLDAPQLRLLDEIIPQGNVQGHGSNAGQQTEIDTEEFA